ncbi:uncharacterized protein LOC134561901 [Prinia subflava]|uniref:uncharacterized protein LOC134561901 n=1 Tax=Prinia subflava TaxID=208062 RepID=UPI002FE0CCDA
MRATELPLDVQRKTRAFYGITASTESTSLTSGGLQPPFNHTATTTLTDRLPGNAAPCAPYSETEQRGKGTKGTSLSLGSGGSRKLSASGVAAGTGDGKPRQVNWKEEHLPQELIHSQFCVIDRTLDGTGMITGLILLKGPQEGSSVYLTSIGGALPLARGRTGALGSLCGSLAWTSDHRDLGSALVDTEAMQLGGSGAPLCSWGQEEPSSCRGLTGTRGRNAPPCLAQRPRAPWAQAVPEMGIPNSPGTPLGSWGSCWWDRGQQTPAHPACPLSWALCWGCWELRTAGTQVHNSSQNRNVLNNTSTTTKCCAFFFGFFLMKTK